MGYQKAIIILVLALLNYSWITQARIKNGAMGYQKAMIILLAFGWLAERYEFRNFRRECVPGVWVWIPEWNECSKISSITPTYKSTDNAAQINYLV